MNVCKSLLGAMVVAGSVALLPSVAEAGHRFNVDRGSRYSHGGYHHGGHSRSSFGFSIGFGSGSYCGPRYSYSSFSYGTYRPHYRSYYRPVYVAPPVYCPPPVVYSAPVYYAPAPVVVVPRTYSAPCYTPSTYYYSGGGYYYGR